MGTTSGALNINDCLMHMANGELPFGGVGASGMGAYHGEHSFKAFTHEKAVLEKSQALDALLTPLLDLRFPPYTPLKQFAVKISALAQPSLSTFTGTPHSGCSLSPTAATPRDSAS